MENTSETQKTKYELRMEEKQKLRDAIASAERGKKLLRNGIIFIVVGLVVIGGIYLFKNASGGSYSLSINTTDHVRGNPNASVTLIEYGDFQCPACGAYFPIVQKLTDTYGDRVAFVFRNFPLSQIHTNAILGALAAEAAGKQGKFFLMHDMLYQHQAEWGEDTNAKDKILGYAKTLGLDEKTFVQDLQDKQLSDKINSDYNSGTYFGIQGTPTFFLQGEKIQNPQSYEDFKALIDAALVKAKPADTANADYHIHADFKVYLNNIAYDFSKAKYQSVEGKELSPYVHLHDGNGNVIHIHKQGVTLKEFFSSLGMELLNTCFTLDDGQKFCNKNDKTLKLFVNDQPVKDIEHYQPSDLDKILLSFGNEDQKTIAKQMDSITSQACMYSLKCPVPKGFKNTEICVVGQQCLKSKE